MGNKIELSIAQELDIPNFVKYVPNFINDVPNFVKNVSRGPKSFPK